MKAVDYYVQVVADIYKIPSATSLVHKGESSSSSASCSSHYNKMIKCNPTSSSMFGPTTKLWALIIILILAFWSIFTGSLTLNWSTAATTITHDFGYPLYSDLDILEVGDREKMVRHMWDVYTHSNTIKLPRFWQRAFEAAYEDMTSDVSSVQNTAVLEIAKMSMFSLNVIFESLPQATTASETDRTTGKETGPSKLQKSRRCLLHV